MWWKRPSVTERLLDELAAARTEMCEARRDAVRLAEGAQSALEHVVAQRFNRPVTVPRETIDTPKPSPVNASTEAFDPNDDAQWMRNMESKVQ